MPTAVLDATDSIAAAVALPSVTLAQPRGFCAGVVRAIDIVERALALHGAPVYVFHEIVHNGHVVAALRERGAVFVNDLADVPAGAVTVFSAHGVSRKVTSQAARRQLDVIDATCPLVTKVHKQAQRYAALGYSIVVIGHPGHEEVEGTMGSVDAKVYLVSTVLDVQALALPSDEPLAYVTQTTLSLDDTRDVIAALEARFPARARAARDRHLLRHAEPPERSARARGAMRPGDRGRRAQQFELGAFARSRGAGRRAGTPGRACRRGRSGLAARCRADRHLRWCLDPRSAGEAGVRSSARARRRQTCVRSKACRRTWCSACRRNCCAEPQPSIGEHMNAQVPRRRTGGHACRRTGAAPRT
jgi:hypothetical protein